jgi:hypothetical protein
VTDKPKPDERLSGDLAAVEKLLAGAFAKRPPQGLRDRVLNSIRENPAGLLAVSAAPDQITWLQFVAGLAAMIVLWANLSFGALHEPLRARPVKHIVDRDRDAALVCTLLPELTADECRSLAMRYLGSASNLP